MKKAGWFVGVFLPLGLVLAGCNNDEQIASCHDKVHARAKYTAEIVTTETKRKGMNLASITGRAKFQNGFGAWSNVRYSCIYQGSTITTFDMQNGWAE